ncbi:MAG: hypothetical protein R2776_06995 [Flavobacteriaceae bacterium]|nr:hypothetical protein [Flavobacteriaceae bacterium]
MAKNKSYIKLEGTLDGLTFYQKDGQSFVKTKGGISKDRILNDSNFKRTRENMQEFAGAARASKAVRDAFASVVKLMGDTYLAARLTGVMKKINRNGTGVRGERTIDLVSNTKLFQGFQFNPKDPLKSLFYAPYDAPVFGANRDSVTLEIADFKADSFVTPPEGATHFTLVLASGLVSNFEYDANVEGYEPVDEDHNGKGLVAYSATFPVTGMVGADITLANDFGLGAALPSTVSHAAALGIIFYQEQNGALYELASGNGMQVIAVG